MIPNGSACYGPRRRVLRPPGPGGQLPGPYCPAHPPDPSWGRFRRRPGRCARVRRSRRADWLTGHVLVHPARPACRCRQNPASPARSATGRHHGCLGQRRRAAASLTRFRRRGRRSGFRHRTSPRSPGLPAPAGARPTAGSAGWSADPAVIPPVSSATVVSTSVTASTGTPARYGSRGTSAPRENAHKEATPASSGEGSSSCGLCRARRKDRELSRCRRHRGRRTQTRRRPDARVWLAQLLTHQRLRTPNSATWPKPMSPWRSSRLAERPYVNDGALQIP